jgi:hypothetical protein
MSAGKSRFSLGAIDTEEVEIPVAPLIARAPVPELVRPAGKGTEPEETVVPVVSVTKIEQLAEADFAPAEGRTNTSLSLPNSLNKELDNWVYDLRKKGHKKMSRQAVMEKALREFLNKPKTDDFIDA